MLNVEHGTELVVPVENKSSELLKVARLLADHGLDIRSLNGYFEGPVWMVRMIVDDALRGEDVLRTSGYKVSAEKVVLVKAPHKPGMLKRIAIRLEEDGITLKRIHVTAVENQSLCLMVLRTNNDDRALVCLSEFIIE